MSDVCMGYIPYKISIIIIIIIIRGNHPRDEDERGYSSLCRVMNLV